MNNKNSPSYIPTIIAFALTWGICLVLIGGAVCSDGWGSSSIGRSGACSHHGGVRTWPGAIALIFSIFIAVKFHSFKNRNKEKEEITPRGFFSQESSRLPATTATPQVVIRKTKRRDNQNDCPRCRSKMVLRTARTGRNAGSPFWGCSKYPRCKGTISFERTVPSSE